MADNSSIDPGSSPTLVVASDEVTYSGDTADVQLVRPVLTTGSEGSKTVVELTGDATYGLDVDVTRVGGTVAVSNAALSVTGGGVESSAIRVTIASDSTGVLSVDDNGGSLTVDGTVAATQSGTWNVGTVTTVTNVVHVDDNSGSLTVDGAVTTTETRPSTSTQSSVSGSASSVTILAANSSRRSASVFNDSTADLYLLRGAGTASTTNFSVRLFPYDYYETPYPVCTVALTGIWSSATGAARVTEDT